MKILKCSNCGNENSKESNYCNICGKALSLQKIGENSNIIRLFAYYRASTQSQGIETQKFAVKNWISSIGDNTF